MLFFKLLSIWQLFREEMKDPDNLRADTISGSPVPSIVKYRYQSLDTRIVILYNTQVLIF